MRFDIYMHVFPLSNRKAAEVSEVGVEKEAKILSIKTVAAAKHRLDRYIAAHKQRNGEK
jgi:hypothetical protein